MSLPDYLCHRTISWLAAKQIDIAAALDEYVAQLDVAGNLETRHEFRLLGRAAHNRAANLTGLAITVEKRRNQS